MKTLKKIVWVLCYLLYLATPMVCMYFLRDNFLVMLSFLVFLFLLYVKDNCFKKLKLHVPFDLVIVFAMGLIFSGFNFSVALDVTTGFCLASLIPLVFTLIGIHLFFLIKCKNPLYFMQEEFLSDPLNEKLIATIRKHLPEGFFDHITNRK